MSKKPQYLQIKHYILEQINNEVWTPGVKVPTEAMLCEQFSVSRMTVSKAIRDLVNDGILKRTPRIGTFVCPPKAASPLMEIRNIADEIENRGQKHRSKIVKLCSIKANAQIATQLGVIGGSHIFYSEIIHYADDVPLQLEQRWVNPLFVPHYLEQDYTTITPNAYLSSSCPLTAIEHNVEATLPTPEIKALLNLEDNTPCLSLHRRTWSNDRLIAYALLQHPGDSYSLYLRSTITR